MALSTCGQPGPTPPVSCPSGLQATSLTLTNGQPQVSYIILWDPIAAMTLSQNTWTPTAASAGSAVTQPITITNTGAPGSKLTWNTSVSVAPGDPNWLSVSPASDNSGITASNSDTVTVSANPAGLSVGQHIGKIQFGGFSYPTGITSNQTLTVTFTVTKAGVTNTVTSVTVSCNPSSVSTGGTSTCTATVNGTGSGAGSGVTWSTNLGSINSTTGQYTAPGNTGTATITATSVQDPTKSGQTTVTISTPPLPTCTPGTCPVCNPALTATPSSIVVPGSSNLSYSCSNVTSCHLTQGGGGAPLSTATAQSGYSVTPASTTTYTLTCTNSSYSGPGSTLTQTATVTVGGTNLCETNPNGAGCPGQ